jgi:hypothetical protein
MSLFLPRPPRPWPQGCWPTDRQRLLIRACLLADEDDARQAWSDWQDDTPLSMIDAASNHLLPLMLPRLDAWGAFLGERRRIQGLVRYHWLRQQLLRRGLESVIGALESRGIDAVLLKGAALSAGTYRDGLRPMNDLDILVRREQSDVAIEALLSAGWRSRFADPGRSARVVHACVFNHASGIELDLHFSPFHERPITSDDFRDVVALAERVPIGGRSTLVPSAADQLVFTCAHGVRYAEVAPCRWLVDACLLIRRSGARLDWTRVRRQAVRYGMELPVALTIRFLADEVGLTMPEEMIRWAARPRAGILRRIEFAAVSGRPWATHVMWQQLVAKTFLFVRHRRAGVRMSYRDFLPIIAFLDPPFGKRWGEACRAAVADLRGWLAARLVPRVGATGRHVTVIGDMRADGLEGFHMPERWEGRHAFRWSSPTAAISIDCPPGDYEAAVRLLPLRPWQGDLEDCLQVSLNDQPLRIMGFDAGECDGVGSHVWRIRVAIERGMFGPHRLQRLSFRCAPWQAAAGDERRLGMPVVKVELLRRAG